jgi:ubiquinone/menaquinone biosynthesis C-methylase UbiE
MVIRKVAFPIWLALLFISFSACSQQNNGAYSSKQPSKGGTGKVYMGREIAGVMSFEGVDWLERNGRMQEEQTALALKKLPIGKGSVVADVGAGSGFYAFKIAERVPGGKIYAVEIQDDAIAYLQEKSSALKLNNVIVVKGSATSPNLPDNAIDLVIMVDVYHELEYPKEFLEAVKKALKPGGKLLLLEYKAEDPAVRIKPAHKMSVAQVQRELGASGYHLSQRGDFLPLQHFLVFQKD